MKRLFSLGAAALLFGITAVGCQNTAEGAKQDATNNTEAVKDVGDKAAMATEKAAKDTAQAAKDAAVATGAAAHDAAAATGAAVNNAAAATGAAVHDAATATKAVADRAASATEKATDRAVSATEKAGKNASDALTLTPKVKLAITNDTGLNDTANLINVESGNNTVELKGHVISKQLKMRAENIARKAVKDAGSDDKVVDSLTVQGQ